MVIAGGAFCFFAPKLIAQWWVVEGYLIFVFSPPKTTAQMAVGGEGPFFFFLYSLFFMPLEANRLSAIGGEGLFYYGICAIDFRQLL